MFNFTQFLNESIHDDYFLNSYRYILPKNDPVKLLFDFYMFSFLYNRKDHKLSVNNKNIDPYQIAMAQYGKWSTVDYDTTSIDYDSNLDQLLIQQVGNKLIPYLHQHFLDSLLFSICCEFRHVYDAFFIFDTTTVFNKENVSMKDLENCKTVNQELELTDNYEKLKYSFFDDRKGEYHSESLYILVRYLKKFNIDTNFINIITEFFYHTFNNKIRVPRAFYEFAKANYDTQDIKKLMNVSPTIEKQFSIHNNTDFKYYKAKDNYPKVIDKTEIDRYQTYLFFNSKNIPDLELVKNFKKIFKIPAWNQSYGGEAWVNICQAYIDLYNAKNIDQQIIQIDHVYDLQHNTGFALNKVYEYEFYEPEIEQALDRKATIHSPYQIIRSISTSFIELASRLIKSKFGTTLQQYKNKKYLLDNEKENSFFKK
jgi:hypothetical protein